MQTIANTLKEHNLKVTPQRIAIYKILINTKEHPSAETIYNELSATHPTISLATVYKTLDTFKVANLVQELNMGECCFRYDADTTNHIHAICQQCHTVFDIYKVIPEDTVKQLSDTIDFTTERSNLFLFGKCNKCLH